MLLVQLGPLRGGGLWNTRVEGVGYRVSSMLQVFPLHALNPVAPTMQADSPGTAPRVATGSAVTTLLGLLLVVRDVNLASHSVSLLSQARGKPSQCSSYVELFLEDFIWQDYLR